MTPQELKNSILQQAIQGKLVEQRPEEGTAEELFEQIQKEKQRLIADGKIKKEKPLPEITEDEKPFDIPESWKWVRLGEISSYAEQKEKVSAKNITDDLWSLDLEDIEKESGKIIKMCRAGERKISGDKVLFRKGQVLYSKLRPYLKKILVAPDSGICSSEIVPFNLYGNINAQYAVYYLKSPYADYVVNSVAYGVKMPRVGTDTMTALLFPLPPLAEQKRIVAKIEELLPYIHRYEESWLKLEALNSRFPSDMKKSLLQYAIQGKLVEQRPEEGTAEELFQQIQEEKQRLIAEGKIKKEKKLPEITEEEKPFDIPESWKWVHLNDIAYSSLGKTLDKVKNTGTLQPYLCSINVYWNGICLDKVKEARFEEAELPKYLLQKGDLLICEGGEVGRSCVWEYDMEMYYQNALHRVRFYQNINPYFYKFLIECYKGIGIIDRFSKGVTIKHLVQNSLNAMWLPLPPLAEQKRIVAKLEELLPLCDRLR